MSLIHNLEKAFGLLNLDFFSNELPATVITLVPSSKVYSRYTSDGACHQIMISVGALEQHEAGVLTLILHEMTHEYNDLIANVVDTSNKGTYHNKRFKEAAETHGLVATRSEKYGWSHTEPSHELFAFMNRHNDLKVTITRINIEPKHEPKQSIQTHHRKYTCPCCGNSVRATKQVNIICGDCGVQMSTEVVTNNELKINQHFEPYKDRTYILDSLPEEMSFDNFMQYLAG